MTFIATAQYGSNDTEDPTFDPVSGDIFWVDGVNTEVYRIDAVNNTFGDADDVMTQFDVGQYGITDTEALEYYSPHDSLIVGDRPGKRLLEVTKTGTLLRVIDLTGISGLSLVSGLTVAPSSRGTGQLNYWIVDRKQDNGANPNENDGKLFEVSAGPTTNTQPVMDLRQHRPDCAHDERHAQRDGERARRRRRPADLPVPMAQERRRHHRPDRADAEPRAPRERRQG